MFTLSPYRLWHRSMLRINWILIWCSAGFWLVVPTARSQDPESLPLPSHSLIAPSSDQYTSQKPPSQVLLRLPESVSHLKLDPFFGKRVAFTEKRTGHLKSVHLQTKQLLTIWRGGVGGAFFWVGDGLRLIFRNQVLQEKNVHGYLRIFDHHLQKTFDLASVKGFSGYPSFDPQDQRILLIHSQGVIQKKLRLPHSRLARWQLQRQEKHGSFAITPQGIMHLSPTSQSMKRLRDDGSGVQSYDISRNGRNIVWATLRGGIYRAQDHWTVHDPTAVLIAYGKDPTWMHGRHNNILFSGARVVGNKIAGYDLRIINPSGKGIWLTQTFASHERWPLSLPEGGIIYTVENTTDLFSISHQKIAPELALISPSSPTSPSSPSASPPYTAAPDKTPRSGPYPQDRMQHSWQKSSSDPSPPDITPP